MPWVRLDICGRESLKAEFGCVCRQAARSMKPAFTRRQSRRAWVLRGEFLLFNTLGPRIN
jgi:hypothetical protein